MLAKDEQQVEESKVYEGQGNSFDQGQEDNNDFEFELELGQDDFAKRNVRQSMKTLQISNKNLLPVAVNDIPRGIHQPLNHKKERQEEPS